MIVDEKIRALDVAVDVFVVVHIPQNIQKLFEQTFDLESSEPGPQNKSPVRDTIARYAWDTKVNSESSLSDVEYSPPSWLRVAEVKRSMKLFSNAFII